MGGYKVWAKREKGHWRARGRIEGLVFFCSFVLVVYRGFEVSFSGLISILLISNSGFTVGLQKKEKQEKQSFAEEQ